MSEHDQAETEGGARLALAPLRGWTKADLTLVAVVVGVSSWILAESAVTHGITDRFGPGAGLFPGLAAGSSLFLMLLFALQGPSRATQPEWPDRTAFKRIGAMLVGIVLVPIGGELFGLLTAALVFTLFMLIGVFRARVLPSLFTVGFAGGLAYVIFFMVLRTPMPRAPWGF